MSDFTEGLFKNRKPRGAASGTKSMTILENHLLPIIDTNEKSRLERKLAQLRAMSQCDSESPSRPILEKVEEKTLKKKFRDASPQLKNGRASYIEPPISSQQYISQ